ncbi:hypothetical protein [Algivirga pacifica]|uniref:Alginate export domain-containing protein n=1 Tax=Algivirga pacifica TaxID=1162670 RepID=A0ABP9DM59_9BACT
MKKLCLLFGFIHLALSLHAQEPKKIFEDDLPKEEVKQLQFYAFYINQAVSSNFYPENVFMKGQVIGRLFGDNTTRTSNEDVTMYVEQRLIPFFIYQPKLFNGRALLRASFEIDYTWGDASYGAGGNLGGAIAADFVNIQTQNIELELIPNAYWKVNLGLMRMFDTPYNPYRTFFDKMLQTGYRLSYWGTDAVGVTARRDDDISNLKLGFYQLYENNIEEKDDVYLTEAHYQQKITPKWKLGTSLYYLSDRSNGEGGVSIYAQGLNSKLNGYNGTFRFFDFGTREYKADIAWVGGYFSRNEDFMMDRWQWTGFFNYNLGVAQVGQEGEWVKGADIAGFSANTRLAYRFGQTINDHFSVDAIFASGDDNALEDKRYSGVITGNTWGAPAGIFIGTGSYLLFPHGNVVNRFTPVVADMSNMGYGLVGGTLKASKDFIPNKLNAKLGLAHANSIVAPQGGGKVIGTEVNTALSYNFGPFMSLEFHAAYMNLGNFYESNDDTYSFDINGTAVSEGRPENPWTAFLVYKWLMF